MKIKATLVVAGLAAGIVSQAAPINANNLVILRAESGTTAGVATVFLDEYTTSGALVQTINVSNAGANALTVNRTGTTEGILSISGNGSLISFGGYRTAVGSTFGTDRAVGTLDLAGNVNTATPTMTAINAGQALRGVATDNGSNFWLGVGGTAGVRYATNAGGASTLIDSRNSRQISIVGNEVFGSNGSTAITQKLQSYGTLPIGPTTPTTVIAQGVSDVIHGFMVMDLDASVAGGDTAYAFNTLGNTLLKYSKVGGSWVSNGSLAGGGGLNLTAIKNGSNIELFANNATGTSLMKLTDVGGGYNTALGTASWTTIATASSGFGFRGISSFKPVPEPGSILALGVGAALLLRRKKA